MKTTLTISSTLVEDAKRLAGEQELTLREVIERGLRDELESRPEPRDRFVWKNLSYGDPNAPTWARPPFREDDWGPIREASYERDDDD